MSHQTSNDFLVERDSETSLAGHALDAPAGGQGSIRLLELVTHEMAVDSDCKHPVTDAARDVVRRRKAMLAAAERHAAVAHAILGEAAGSGRPPTAVIHLERVPAERAPGEDRAQRLTELGDAAFDAGRSDAAEPWWRALDATADVERRIAVLTRLSADAVMHGAGTVDELLRRLRDARRTSTGRAARVAADAATLDALLARPDSHAERARRAAALHLEALGDPLLKRVAMAHRAWVDTELGRRDARGCAELALEALEGGHLLRAARRRVAYHLCVGVLVLTDRVDQARSATAALRAEGLVHDSVPLRAAASWYEAELALRAGSPREAAALEGASALPQLAAALCTG